MHTLLERYSRDHDWLCTKRSISSSGVSRYFNDFLVVRSCVLPHDSHMVWSASHFCGINHVVVPLSSPDALIGVALVCFCWACHHVQSRVERLIRTLKLHESPEDCSRWWARIGFPWQLETASGCITVLSAGKDLLGLLQLLLTLWDSLVLE